MKAQINQSNKLQDIFFPVRLELTSDITGMEANPECVNSVVATIDGKDIVLATCGERYNLISNEEIFTPIIAKLDELNIEHTISVNTRNNSRFEVKINIIDQRFAIEIESGDFIYPQICLNRSYDGGSKYNGQVGYFRMICTNGLTIPYGDKAFSVSGKHTEKLSYTLDKIYAMIDNMIENAEEVSKRYEVLTDRVISNYGERVEAVMNATGIKKGYDDIMASIRTEAAKLNKTNVNDWLIYNGINAYIFNNDKNVKSDEVRRELDKKVLEVMMK